MVNFDIETANADQLMNEIIRISLHEYNILGEKIAQPIPKGQEVQLVDEMVDKYIVNERLLNAYFRKLKRLLKNKPPGPQELEKKEREIDDLMKKNGLA